MNEQKNNAPEQAKPEKKLSRTTLTFYIVGLFSVAIALILISYVAQARADRQVENLSSQLNEQQTVAQGATQKVADLQQQFDLQSSALESVRSTLGTEQAKTDVVGATQNLREREQMLEMLVAAEQAVIDDDMEQLNYLLEGIKDAFSENQLKLRAERLGVQSDALWLLCETSLDEILAAAERMQPGLLIVDSIQTLYTEDKTSSPGSIAQVRDCTMRLMQYSKRCGVTVFVVGHINKEGAIAGPKVLEHMVDCVLYFEGDQSMSYRILRAAKNRFGSTNEIGVFEMEDSGLREVTNPSEMLLSGRPTNTPGTCVVGVMEGSRTVLAEVQALVTPSGYSGARRNANGIDYNRAMLLLAVLEKRAGFSLSSCDAYINVVGGLRLDEPATDLAVILAIASSYKDLPVGSDLAAVGEVGLSGEIRSVSHLNQRLSEIARLGFRRCIIPAHVRDDVQKQNGLQTIPVKNIREALKAVFGA